MQRVRDNFLNTLQVMVKIRDKKVLELGCGGGYYSAQLASYCKQLVGLDPNKAKIHEARRRRILNAEFRVASAQDTGLASRSFDVTLFTLSLHHVFPPLMCKAIDEAVRVTKASGYIVFLEPAMRGNFYDAEIRFDACDGDERGLKSAAQRCITTHPRITVLHELGDSTAFEFSDSADFVASMKPKKNLSELESFLLRYNHTLEAERRISICKPRD